LAGVLTRVLAHRTERDPESREFRLFALFRELTGVAQQVEQNLLEPHGVGRERGHVLFRFDVAPFSVLVWRRAGRRPRQIPKGRA
jgi:hypothetical protein